MGKIHSVTMPTNGISDVGKEAIQMLLYDNGLLYLPNDWIWDFRVTGKSAYVGSFSKRVGKYLANNGQKLSPELRGEIGTLAASHCEKEGKTYHFEFVKTFCWERGDHGDPSSCFWECHAGAKSILEGRDEFSAMLFYKDEDGQEGIARSFLWEVNNCTIVWNTYGFGSHGACGGNLVVGRVLALFNNHAYYKKLLLKNKEIYNGLIWINCESYVVGDQDDVLAIGEQYDLDINCDVRCNKCKGIIKNTSTYVGLDNHNYCEDCYFTLYRRCSACSVSSDYDSLQHINGYHYCQSCYDQRLTSCHDCATLIYQDTDWTDGEHKYCQGCWEKRFVKCVGCGNKTPIDEATDKNGKSYCKECVIEEAIEPTKADATEHFVDTTRWMAYATTSYRDINGISLTIEPRE